MTIFYVGETLHPRQRLADHVKGSFDPFVDDYVKQVYIRSLVDDGLYPAMIIIDCIESDCKVEVHALETIHADALRQHGIAVASGGTPRYALAHLEKDLETFTALREMFLYD